MPTSNSWARLTWLVLFALAATLAITQHDGWLIDTDLADVTPNTLTSVDTAEAVVNLRSDIESRVILMLTAEQGQALEAAYLDARERLESLSSLGKFPQLELLPDNQQNFDSLLEQLKPYRFNFLTDSQRELLATQTPEQLAQAAAEALYRYSSSPRIFSFSDDPLGWHGEALLDTLQQIAAPDGDSETRLINLRIGRGAMDLTTQTELANEFSTLIERLSETYGATTYRSGVFFFAADAANKSRSDVKLISTISTAGIVVLLLLAFKRLRSIALPVVSVVAGVAFATVITQSLFGALHILTIVFGASLIGIAIDYALHYLVHQSDQGTRQSAALYRALGLSLITSMVGYAALGFGGLPALQKVAVFSCSGLLMAWLTVVAFGGLFSAPPDHKDGLLFSMKAKLTGALQVLPKIAWYGLLLVFLLITAVAVQKPDYFSDDPRVFFNADPVLIDSERRVAEATSNFEPGRYIAVVGSSIGEVYERVDLLMAKIASQGEYVRSDFSGIPLWLTAPEQQRRNYQAMVDLYRVDGAADKLAVALTGSTEAAREARQAYLKSADRNLSPATLNSLFGSSLPPAWFDNSEGQIVAFLLVKKGLNVDNVAAITRDLRGVEYVNTLQRTSDALQQQRHTATQFLAIAFALIGLILLLRYRTLRGLANLLIPLGAVTGFLALCFLMSIPVNLFHIMALFLVLGFGMDYAIFSHEMAGHLDVALRAIFLSALTSLLSFGLLAVSETPVVSSFGFTLLIGNTLNLVGAIILAQKQKQQNNN